MSICVMIIQRHITLVNGAKACEFSYMQMLRVYQKYCLEGDAELIHGNRGRSKRRSLEETTKTESLSKKMWTRITIWWTGTNWWFYSWLVWWRKTYLFTQYFKLLIKRYLLLWKSVGLLTEGDKLPNMHPLCRIKI